jgi:nucleotide-binding universal stress UspA family protein
LNYGGTPVAPVRRAGCRSYCKTSTVRAVGRRGIAHALIGSDAERVVRMSPVAVLLVRAAQAA